MARTPFAVVLLTALLAACGGSESADEELETQAEAPAPVTANDPAPQATAQSNPSTTPLTADDIDRWRRGMAAELEAIAEAESALQTASTANDTLNTMMAVSEMSTRGAGARGAGLDEERYQFVRRTLSSAVGYLSPLEQEMDVTQMPPEMREQFEQSRNANLERMGDVLPNSIIEALRPQAVELRQQDMAVTAARIRVAEAAR